MRNLFLHHCTRGFADLLELAMLPCRAAEDMQSLARTSVESALLRPLPRPGRVPASSGLAHYEHFAIEAPSSEAM